MWYYKLHPFESEDIGDAYGFVYKITCAPTQRMYIGKKYFWSAKTKMVKKKKKRIIVESDWQKYWGSSVELKKDIEELGEHRFTREILHLCKSKGDTSYMEAREQFNRNVLLKEEYYNRFIGCRINANHLKNITTL